MASVARWRTELERLGASERAELVRRADEICAHRFELLGSGPVDLGREIDWHRDFKSGRSWPPVHCSRITVSYPDQSDIKVPWELSRFQHLPLLAATYRLTGEGRYLDEIGDQMRSWIRTNPVELGVNWASTMDVAIRAANWVATLVICAQSAEGFDWLREVLGSLLLHGRFVRSHLEHGSSRGNHYLANVVGLQAIASVFSHGREGRRWALWATRELEAELAHQVRADGCDHEMSTSYHRLVTEMFLLGTEAADVLTPGALTPEYRERLARMLQFTADYTRPDGLAPLIGDDDSGRYLPLGDYGAAHPRWHGHLFRQSGRPPLSPRGHVAYPDGGFYVMRDGPLYLIVRCGDVGLDGAGCHAHNDQLSFELALACQPMVVDPGSFAYTGNPAARNQFRSTAYHSTLSIDGAEQSPLYADRLFALSDRARAQAIEWAPNARRAVFEGEHRGFTSLDPPAVHRRRIEVDGKACVVRIRDTVFSRGPHRLLWSFPLAPGDAKVDGDGVTATFPAGRLRIEGRGLEFAVEAGWLAPAYGFRIPISVVRARRLSVPDEDAAELTLSAIPH